MQHGQLANSTAPPALSATAPPALAAMATAPSPSADAKASLHYHVWGWWTIKGGGRWGRQVGRLVVRLVGGRIGEGWVAGREEGWARGCVVGWLGAGLLVGWMSHTLELRDGLIT